MTLPPKPDVALFHRVARAVGDVYGVSFAQLRGRARPAFIVEARFVAMGYCVECGLSLSRVAVLFERDHVTVIHALKWLRHVLGQNAAMVTRQARFLAMLQEKPSMSSEPSHAAEELLREIVFTSGADRDLALSRAASFLAGRAKNQSIKLQNIFYP